MPDTLTPAQRSKCMAAIRGKDAHAALDRAVVDAYGFTPRQDILAALLGLNLKVAARIDAGKPVTAPGVPGGFPDPASLVTDDCIKA